MSGSNKKTIISSSSSTTKNTNNNDSPPARKSHLSGRPADRKSMSPKIIGPHAAGAAEIVSVASSAPPTKTQNERDTTTVVVKGIEPSPEKVEETAKNVTTTQLTSPTTTAPADEQSETKIKTPQIMTLTEAKRLQAAESLKPKSERDIGPGSFVARAMSAAMKNAKAGLLGEKMDVQEQENEIIEPGKTETETETENETVVGGGLRSVSGRMLGGRGGQGKGAGIGDNEMKDTGGGAEGKENVKPQVGGGVA